MFDLRTRKGEDASRAKWSNADVDAWRDIYGAGVQEPEVLAVIYEACGEDAMHPRYLARILCGESRTDLSRRIQLRDFFHGRPMPDLEEMERSARCLRKT